MTTNPREQDGLKIAEQPDQVKRIDDNFYQVKAQSLKFESWYDVVRTETGLVCDCPDFQWRKTKCKHVFACEFSLKLREQVKQEIVIEQIGIDKCPKCQSTNIIKHGIRHYRKYDLQRYSCKDCKNRFSFNLGFEKMRTNPQTITSAMQLYFTGESLRNVQKFLKLQGVETSHKTIYAWVKKYTNLMEKYLDKITPNVSDKWRADELYLKIKGNNKFLYAMMDDETRFWIAQQVFDKKYNEDIRPFFKMAKEKMGKKPMTLITDGANNFAYAFKKEYASHKKPRSVHIRHIHMKEDRNNNKMERLNGEIRDREKVLRGLKKEDSCVLSGYQIYHNYIRSHMGLNGDTPADRVGIKIQGNNKWITLIQNASQMK